MIIKDDKQLEELFSKIFSDDIVLSYSEVDVIGEYLAKNADKVTNKQILKFISIMYKMLKNDIISRQ